MATARVQVTVEIDCPSNWGNTTTCQQVFDQAGEEAINGLKNILDNANKEARRVQYMIVGEPKVLAVIYPKK